MEYSIIMSNEIRLKAQSYFEKVRVGYKAGFLLSSNLNSLQSQSMDFNDYLDALLNTKLPQIFAESALVGDGSDWNLEELSILGDISIGMPVKVFDNGLHTSPIVHDQPLEAVLVCTPGALLRNDHGFTPADYQDVTSVDGSIDSVKYNQLYARRLLPVFDYINEHAKKRGEVALITIPGLGSGQFAGKFHGQLEPYLKAALKELLSNFSHSFDSIGVVYFDPYSVGENERTRIRNIEFLVRPFKKGNEGKAQLSLPANLSDKAKEFKDCSLYSIVAWDHVSWPGNDFWVGARVTDDGVKASATDSMYKMTEVRGEYDISTNKYMPPKQYSNWAEVISKNKLRIFVKDNVLVY